MRQDPDINFEFKAGDDLNHDGWYEKYDDELYCPFCLAQQHHETYMYDYRQDEETSTTECCECEKEFEFQVDLIIRGGDYYGDNGKRSRVPSCKGGHQYVMSGRRLRTRGWCSTLQDIAPLPADQHQTVTEMTCVVCGDRRVSFGPEGTTFMLPWRDEYNNPDFFDPDGLLKGTTEDLGVKCLSCGETGIDRDSLYYKDDDYPDELLAECPNCFEEDTTKFRDMTILDTPYKEPVELTKAIRAVEHRKWETEWYYEKLGSRWEREKPKHLAYKPWQPVNVADEVNQIVEQVKKDHVPRMQIRGTQITITFKNPEGIPASMKHEGKQYRLHRTECNGHSTKAVYQEDVFVNRFDPATMVTAIEANEELINDIMNYKHHDDAIDAYQYYLGWELPEKEKLPCRRWLINKWNRLVIALCGLLLISGCHSFDPNKPYSIHKTDSLYNGEQIRITERSVIKKNVPTQLPCETVFVVQEGHIVGWYCVDKTGDDNE